MATPRKTKTKAKPVAKAAPAKSAPKKEKAVLKNERKSTEPKPIPARNVVAVKTKPVERRTSTAVTEMKEVKPAIEKAPKEAPKTRDFDAAWVREVRDMLMRQRDKLMTVVQSTQAQLADRFGDSADVSDRASEGFEDELDVGLMAIEAAQLEDIDDAIRRIDDNTYGLCADCEKPIPRKRLEILPFARRCLPCEGNAERQPRRGGGYEEDDKDRDMD